MVEEGVNKFVREGRIISDKNIIFIIMRDWKSLKIMNMVFKEKNEFGYLKVLTTRIFFLKITTFDSVLE